MLIIAKLFYDSLKVTVMNTTEIRFDYQNFAKTVEMLT